MQNILIERDGDKLKIEIDLSEEIGPSNSHKTIIVAKTSGCELILPEELKKYGFEMNLVLYKYIHADEVYKPIVPKAKKRRRFRSRLHEDFKKS